MHTHPPSYFCFCSSAPVPVASYTGSVVAPVVTPSTSDCPPASGVAATPGHVPRTPAQVCVCVCCLLIDVCTSVLRPRPPGRVCTFTRTLSFVLCVPFRFCCCLLHRHCFVAGHCWVSRGDGTTFSPLPAPTHTSLHARRVSCARHACQGHRCCTKAARSVVICACAVTLGHTAFRIGAVSSPTVTVPVGRPPRCHSTHAAVGGEVSGARVPGE